MDFPTTPTRGRQTIVPVTPKRDQERLLRAFVEGLVVRHAEPLGIPAAHDGHRLSRQDLQYKSERAPEHNGRRFHIVSTVLFLPMIYCGLTVHA